MTWLGRRRLEANAGDHKKPETTRRNSQVCSSNTKYWICRSLSLPRRTEQNETTRAARKVKRKTLPRSQRRSPEKIAISRKLTWWCSGVWHMDTSVLEIHNKIFYLVYRVQKDLGQTKPLIQWVQGAFSHGIKRPECEADNSPLSNNEVKICGGIPSLPHKFSWHGA